MVIELAWSDFECVCCDLHKGLRSHSEGHTFDERLDFHALVL
jgi:hypothetical protein